MKYILNETPLKTTNNFKINNITVDLDIKETEFNEYNLSFKNDLDIKTEIKAGFDSKIGLKTDKYLYLDITPKKDIKDVLIINYEFNNNSYLASIININLEHDLNTIIVFRSNTESFLNFKLSVNSKENINSNITLVNLTSDLSTSLIAIENSVDTNSNIITNYVDIKGKLRISNYYSDLYKENSSSSFNTIYIGNNDERLDMNYYVKNNNKKTISNMLFQGALTANSYKSLKGTIDFVEHSSKSKGEENENCILLGDKCKSRSLPMLLCHEEDVVGSHGMSSGKIDSEKLFYLMSKGITEEEAKRLIIKANFKIVLDNIIDDGIKNEIEEIINERIK